jgi:hypothetical protein
MTRCGGTRIEKNSTLARRCHQALLHMPSSASVERVFSILKNIIGDQQSNDLKDLVEGTMLVNFNQRQRAAGK